MLRIVAVLLMLAALWRAWIDWQATIGEGYAYRLTPIQPALAEIAPGPAARLFDAWRSTTIPYLWDPIGATVASLPAALVLAGLASLLWVTRRRRR